MTIEGIDMLLENKNAVIYGAGGAIGAAVARAFGREGARVFLTGRNPAALDAVAKDITANGGTAETAVLDSLDEGAVEAHADGVVRQAGSLDISFNAISLPQHGIQGTPIAQLSLANFRLPVDTYAISHFLTTRAAARRMAPNGSGVILTLTAVPGRQAAPLVGGMAWSWAGIEALTRTLSAELGPSGVRVVCMRPDGLPETATIDVVYGQHADTIGVTVPEYQAIMDGMTHRKRAGTLAEVANLAAFLASDQASIMTGTIVNMTGGSAPD
jgi:NAD(P)-dependent dehydrogenase (short-subunit alcohol dehydrogenase family)